MQIEVVLDAGAIIGESPTWDAGEGSLYWIDVKRPALYRYHPKTAAQRAWPMPADIGAFALMQDPPGAIVALRHGLFRLRFADGTLTLLAPPPFDPLLFRFNEGACDSAGRFWVGVMFDPLEPQQAPRAASLHRFTLREGLRHEPDAAQLHNGMAWSRDGRRFYLTHSRKREVFAFDFEPDSGRLGARRLFTRIADTGGVPDGAVPDGAAVDAEDGYWCALHGAGRLRRYLPTGEMDRDIMLPVSQPTMCAFGGEALDELYVTSAADQLDPAQRQREPLAGALLRVRPGGRGIARPSLAR
ncbi:MAG TPA: SMP-30/gluconolactonase/LRE family protein [Steroidobacteraceae bacterium]|jgi:sugar lactone lactonase YvrE|nr:SMP-30/gluconolactonase/LRE family protein [Steroidobacteraceae bacterium]